MKKTLRAAAMLAALTMSMHAVFAAAFIGKTDDVGP